MPEKKILFIGTGFYDYDQVIVSELELLGYKVDYYCEIPKYNQIIQVFGKRFIFKEIKNKLNKKQNKKIVNQCGTNYFLVLIIKCSILTVESIIAIKSKNPTSRFLLYLWDSVINIPGLESKLVLFDRIFSFDKNDCLKYKEFVFLPLFFRKEFNNNVQNNKELEFDLFHLGVLHSDRDLLIKKIIQECESQSLKYKILLFTPSINYFFSLFKTATLHGLKRFLINSPIKIEDNIDLIKRSKTVLDIAHPNQSGLTMRTIELLGMQKKLITTNRTVSEYDFFNANNILVIDRENPKISTEFLETNYIKIHEDIRQKYSIKVWIDKIINSIY